MADNYTYTISTTDEDDTKVEVKVVPELWLKTMEDTLIELAKETKIAGFRPGKAPHAQIEATLGNKLPTEAIRKLLPEVASEIMEKEDFNPLTQVDYDVKEIQPDGAVDFSFTFANYPKIELGDFTKLNIEKPKTEVTDADVAEVVERLMSDNTPVIEGETEPEVETKPGKKSKKTETKTYTDEEVAKLGLPNINTLAELQKTVRERLENLKDNDSLQKLENELIDAAVKASKFTLPHSLVHSHAHQLIDAYIARIQDLNVDVNQFLEAQGLDHDKLHEQKEEEAKASIGADLVLNEIVRTNNLLPTPEDVQMQIDGLSDDAMKAEYDTFDGRRYILSMLVRQRGLQKLKEMAGLVEAKK